MGSSVRATALACVAFAALIAGKAIGEEPLGAIWSSTAGEIGVDGGVAVYRPRSEEEGADETPSRFRFSFAGTSVGHLSPHVSASTRDPATGRIRDTLADIALSQRADGRFETPWLVVVADAEDRSAPWLAGRALLARLGDVVEVRTRIGARAAVLFRRSVGTRGGGDGPLDNLSVVLRATVLREAAGGPPSLGGDERGAAEIVADQLDVANRALAQCHVVARLEGPVRFADPPGPGLVHVGGRYGLPAAGGELRLEVDGALLAPVRIETGASPEAAAHAVAAALTAAGYQVDVFLNDTTGREASSTADLVVRRPGGATAAVALRRDPDGERAPVPVELGGVDLSDGLSAYGADEIGVGTLEERSLVRSLRGPRDAIELFFVGAFAGDAKQGESFLCTSGIGPAVVLDRRGVARARQAYTLAHEIAHVLLGDLGHPDDAGTAPTHLLMHSRSSSARFGPKRLTEADCGRIRENASELLGAADGPTPSPRQGV